MKYVLTLLLCGFIAISFIGRKCDHVFVSVEQSQIKVNPYPTMTYSSYSIPPTGSQEGKELICVKCLHIQKQIVDYGAPPKYLLEGDLGIKPGIIIRNDDTGKIVWSDSGKVK